MKNVAKLLFTLGIVIMMFSCTKETTNTDTTEPVNEPKQQVGGSGVGTSVNMGGDGCCRDFTTLLDSDANEWCCVAGSNCASCVIIVGSVEMILDEIVTSGSSAVADFFEGEEWDDIFPTLAERNPQMLVKLQSGNYSLEKLYDSDLNKVIYKASNLEGDYFGLPAIVE